MNNNNTHWTEYPNWVYVSALTLLATLTFVSYILKSH
jgi:hypothetical protein